VSPVADDNITIGKLQASFPGEVVEADARQGDPSAVLRKDRISDICRFLRDDPDLSYRYFIDLCGVDYLDLGRKPRFAVVYHLFSLDKKHRIRLKVPLEESDLTIDSVADVWKGAEWFEREAFDMFGIRFTNHPFLYRILTHHQFVGHPLRKDYPADKRHPCTEPWDLDFN
jgi:NADH-quinone oxidoreductase subunit C